MAWSSLASNQMVSYTDAQGGGFTLQPGQSSVTSNQCMTKADATTKYVLDTSFLTSYASNQLIPKSVWQIGCCAPTLNSVVYTGSTTANVNFTLGCGTCSITTIQTSTDNVNWTNSTGGCSSPRSVTAPTVTTYFRIFTTCPNSQVSTVSNTVTFTPTTTTTTTVGSKTLYMNFYAASCTGDSMQVYKNGVNVFSATVGGASGSVSVVAGDSIQVSVTSGIKGFACEDALAEISANSYYSNSASGFSATATVYYTIQSIDPANIYAAGYIGMV